MLRNSLISPDIVQERARWTQAGLAPKQYFASFLIKYMGDPTDYCIEIELDTAERPLRAKLDVFIYGADELDWLNKILTKANCGYNPRSRRFFYKQLDGSYGTTNPFASTSDKAGIKSNHSKAYGSMRMYQPALEAQPINNSQKVPNRRRRSNAMTETTNEEPLTVEALVQKLKMSNPF